MSDIDVRAELAHWIENVQDADLAAELADMQAKADAGDDAAMTDAFFQNLSFGTAGLRGVLGAGTNRMNIYTVGRATQGFADYLNANFDNPSVAIARDSRNNGELFVRTTAAIMAANGVTAYVYPRISPVPTLSWAVRDFGLLGRHLHDGQPQPRAVQRLQGLRPRWLSDHQPGCRRHAPRPLPKPTRSPA